MFYKKKNRFMVVLKYAIEKMKNNLLKRNLENEKNNLQVTNLILQN